jgi:hypothetical protein
MNAAKWARMKALLADAAERSPAERERYINERCDDSELRGELLALVAAPAQLSDIVSAASFASGDRLGPYVIEAIAGRGGMGEVYRAHDSRLGRHVAIKVLPASLANDPGRLARFEREGRILASLNHPHICSLFDVGREEDVGYLVMEYVEGELLADRIRKGPLPLDRALSCGIQIADALDKAHARGVVHRDLKPGNVMLTSSGVKVLDFGLARSRASAIAAPNGARPLDSDLTTTGTIVGTSRYMAPEQLQGTACDSRTDIWAFGCLLYEMITGARAFDGGTDVAVAAAIFERHPSPPSARNPELPPSIDHVVDRCLTPAPEDRWQSAADLRHELEWIAERARHGAEPTQTPAARRRWMPATILALAATAFVILMAAAAILRAPRNASAPQPMRLTLGLPERLLRPNYLAFSPDGRQLAFVAKSPDDTEPLIWIRSMDALDVKPLRGTEGIRQLPFWSPDGRSVGFFHDGKLKRVDVASNAIQIICDAPDGRGGTWGPDGTIVFAPDAGSALFKVASTGSSPVAVTALGTAPAEQSHRLPSFLSDGRHFVFTVMGDPDWYALALGSLDGPATSQLARWDGDPRFPFDVTEAVPAGEFLMFARAQALVAQPLDRRTWRLVGEATPIAPRVAAEDMGRHTFAVSPGGTLVYGTTTLSGIQPMDRRQLTWITRSGVTAEKVWDAAPIGDFSVSPDGRRVAVSRENPRTAESDIWIVDLQRGTGTLVTPGGRYLGNPLWSRDGTSLLYTVAHSLGAIELLSMPADGNGPERRLQRAATSLWPIGWSADGAPLVVSAGPASGGYAVLSLQSGDTRPSTPIVRNSGHFFEAAISPNGHLLAYGGYETSGGSRGELFVQPLPDGPRVQVGGAGAYRPAWRGDGRELYYVSNGKLMAAQVFEHPTVEIGTVTPLFNVPEQTVWAPSPDGQRFLVALPAGAPPAPAPLMVVVPWTAAR